MKKTLITLLGVLVLCIVMVSCQNNPIDETLDLTLAPSVSKALNESAEQVDESLTSVTDFYWDYWCDTTTPDKSGVEFKNFSFKKSGTATYMSDDDAKAEKGLGIIRGITKGNKYYFGLKGYSDEARTQLAWEGYTGLDDIDAFNAKEDYRNIRISSKTAIVKIHVFSQGSGQLAWNISAPYDEATDTNDNSMIDGVQRYTLYNSTYFYASWYKIGSKDAEVSHDTFDSEDAGFGSLASNNNTKITYNTTDSPEYWDVGTYLFTVSQIDCNTGNVVPGRKQVLVVNISAGAVTTIEGSLDSTIGASIDWDASQCMKVIFHSTYGDEITTLNITNNKSGLAMTTATNVVNTKTGGTYTFSPEKTGTNSTITWFVNGVEYQDSVLAPNANNDGPAEDEDDNEPTAQIQKANEYGSYVFVNSNTGLLTFVRGSGVDDEEKLDDSNTGMTDLNSYLITCVLNIDSANAKSFSFTLKYASND